MAKLLCYEFLKFGFLPQKEQRLTILKKRLAEKKEEEEECQVAAVAQINSSFNNNVETKVVPSSSNEGLRNRRANGETPGETAGLLATNNPLPIAPATHENLRGITVLRSGPLVRPPEEHVESYL